MRPTCIMGIGTSKPTAPKRLMHIASWSSTWAKNTKARPQGPGFLHFGIGVDAYFVVAFIQWLSNGL